MQYNDIDIDIAEKIAEGIRHQPFHTLTNNCVIKSFKFKKACEKAGIEAAVVMTLGVVELRRFGLHARFLFCHTWVDINNTRVEVARPLGQKSPWGTYDIELKPLIGIWIR